MRYLMMTLALLFTSQLAFAAPDWKSNQPQRDGMHQNYHHDDDDFMDYKREKMQRYRNNEMVHDCIRNADSKRDIGLCIKDNKAERKSERHDDKYYDQERRYKDRNYETNRERREMHERYRDEDHHYDREKDRKYDRDRERERDEMHDRMHQRMND